jgi:hypothetical protein
MRNIIYLLSALLLGSCIDYDDVSREVSVQVKLQMPEEFTKGSDLEGHDIVMSQDGNKLTATTNAEGIATFTGLIPDVYDISCSWEITNEQYMALTGEQAVTNGCTVSGSLNEQLMSEAQEQQPILLPTHVAVKRDIVIGKIAAAGSKDANNRNYLAGRYVELYNQADNAVDVSGLYIGLLETTSPQPYTLDNLHEDYADSVVIVKQVFQIPADKPCMVASGGTVLLTNSATDHSDVNEFEYDLTDADFESKDETGKTMNNPAVPALITTFSVFAKNATMNLMQGGPCGIILFRTTEDINTWPHTYGYGKTTGSLYYLCVPKRVILDGVDYLKNMATGVDVSSKRLYADIDAGYTNIEAISGYTGEVVYRRTASIAADGHKILMDTNNSLNDFKVSTTIKPRQYDEE